MIAIVFPGQGSQRKGMGQGLFDEIREFIDVEKDVDAILGYSLRELCLQDAEQRLKETQFTQPCLYTVNALHFWKSSKEGVRPQFVAGHSLGEYNALLAAGVFDFLTGLKLVKKRGELMAQARSGGMGAVIGLSESVIAEVLADHGLTSVDIANFNSPTEIVISGPVADVGKCGPLLEKAGARMFVPLQVSAAFHSRYMADAARAFADFLAPFSFDAPKITVIANATAQPYPTLNASMAVKDLLTRQITSSVQWVRSVGFMSGQGVVEFKAIGPGTVLASLIRQIQQHKQL
jgi:malonyl CoA-acyl carrier protein transacylase